MSLSDNYTQHTECLSLRLNQSTCSLMTTLHYVQNNPFENQDTPSKEDDFEIQPSITNVSEIITQTLDSLKESVLHDIPPIDLPQTRLDTLARLPSKLTLNLFAHQAMFHLSTGKVFWVFRHILC